MYVFVHVCMCVCVFKYVKVSVDAKEGIGYFGAGVKYYCQLPNVGTKNPIPFL